MVSCIFSEFPRIILLFYVFTSLQVHFSIRSEKSNMYHPLTLGSYLDDIDLVFPFSLENSKKSCISHFQWFSLLSYVDGKRANKEMQKQIELRYLRTCGALFPMVSYIFSEVPHKIFFSFAYPSIQFFFHFIALICPFSFPKKI